MRPSAPCKPNGIDCPDRAVGCHASCGKYLEFKAAIDSYNAERERQRKVDDYMNRRIWARRRVIRATEKGKAALSQR